MLFQKHCRGCGRKMSSGSLICKSCGHTEEITDAQFNHRMLLYHIGFIGFEIFFPAYPIVMLFLYYLHRTWIPLVLIPLMFPMIFLANAWNSAYRALSADYIEAPCLKKMLARLGDDEPTEQGRLSAMEGMERSELVKRWERTANALRFSGYYEDLPFLANTVNLFRKTIPISGIRFKKNCFCGVWIVCGARIRFPADLRVWERTNSEQIPKAQRMLLFKCGNPTADRTFCFSSPDPERAKQMMTPAFFELLSQLHGINDAKVTFGAIDGTFHILLGSKKRYRTYLNATYQQLPITANERRSVFEEGEQLTESILTAVFRYKASITDLCEKNHVAS